LAGVALPLALFAIGALAGSESVNSAAMPPHGVRIKIRQTIARCILSNDLLSPEDHVDHRQISMNFVGLTLPSPAFAPPIAGLMLVDMQPEHISATARRSTRIRVSPEGRDYPP
jgi:hypothetical protein